MATAALALIASLTACGSHSKQPAAYSGGGPATAKLNQPSKQASTTTVRLIWSHTGTFFDDPQVWYVAQVKNAGSSVASVALDGRALDKSGTIVGSSENTLPNIPAHQSFDYFGYIGGGGALDTKLTGTPEKIEVSQAKDAFGKAGAVEQPMLKTSDLVLTKGSDDTYTDAPLSYSLSVKVTNSTRDELTGGVTQQVVLYDAAGHVVGGDTGSSDNVPDHLPAGMSYREKWSGIPALGKATRAVYTVWAD
jgi:hypothetical protein